MSGMIAKMQILSLELGEVCMYVFFLPITRVQPSSYTWYRTTVAFANTGSAPAFDRRRCPSLFDQASCVSMSSSSAWLAV